MNLPNIMSLSRIILTPFMVAYLFWGIKYFKNNISFYISFFILFVILEFTDFLDGYLARKYKDTSEIGKVLDPFSDVVMNLSFMISFSILGYLPLYLVLIVLYREVGIIFLRMIIAQKNIFLGANILGKVKTVFYIISIGAAIVLIAIDNTEILKLFNSYSDLINNILLILSQIIYVISALLSVLSLLIYIKEILKK